MKPTLFTVGPVEMYPATLEIGGMPVPYFRTEEFSAIMKENDAILRDLARAPDGSRTVFLTCSGTGAMESVLVNLFGPNDRVLVVNGGTFGERFCEICETYDVAHDTILVKPGDELELASIEARDLSNYAALIVNAHETSTGALYDLRALGALCRKYGLLFVVDAISAFLCDEIDMELMGIDILITCSQKALALAPGLSMVVLTAKILKRLEGVKCRAYYLDIRRHLADMERGQTPFTPAVGILLQLHDRLLSVRSIGVDACLKRSAALAAYFRTGLKGLPFRVFPSRPSNALTALSPTDGRSAYDIYLSLKEKNNLVVTPNGGTLRDFVFRVGHMGNITESDLDVLLSALKVLSR